MRILVIEQEGSVARWLSRTFGPELHVIDVAASAAEATRLMVSREYDLVVVDADPLLDENGRSVIAEIRRIGVTWPLIVVSSSGEDRSVIDAVNAGADDYVVKPVSEGVLVAHVRAVLRRSQPTRSDQIFVGDVVLNRPVHQVSGPLGEVSLTAKEFVLLELLLSNPHRLVPRSELLARVWGFTFDPRTSVVEVAVSRVRRKLAMVSARVRVQARRNVGFVVVAESPDEESAERPAAVRRYGNH